MVTSMLNSNNDSRPKIAKWGVAFLKSIGCLVVLVGFLFCLVLFLMVDYAIKLPHHYELVRTSGSTIFLANENGIIVEPDVDGYAVRDDLVVGHVIKNADEPGSTPGYFIADMKTHKTVKGLDKRHWLRRLYSRGIMAEPRLVFPSRWRMLASFSWCR
jgi:hypothetical protein